MSGFKKFTIVYKTYTNDLDWLKLSLISMKTYLDASNIEEILIYSHDICAGNVYKIINDINLSSFIPCRIIPVHYNIHGYIKQMVVKCLCYKDVKTDYIAILDCDCILTSTLHLENYITEDGLVVWRYLMKEDDLDGVQWTVWKQAFEDSTLTSQNVHYMYNSFPFIFTTKSLELADRHFIKLHGVGYDQWCENRMKGIDINKGVTSLFTVLSTVFEEFEYLGFYCHNYSDDYKFIDSKTGTRNICLKQYWSHGGVPDHLKT